MIAESVHCKIQRDAPMQTIEAAAKSKPHENPKQIEVTKQKQDRAMANITKANGLIPGHVHSSRHHCESHVSSERRTGKQTLSWTA
jgi:UDP-2,3-diacylglucosamine pyrophosphatase LpxH